MFIYGGQRVTKIMNYFYDSNSRSEMVNFKASSRANTCTQYVTITPKYNDSLSHHLCLSGVKIRFFNCRPPIYVPALSPSNTHKLICMFVYFALLCPLLVCVRNSVTHHVTAHTSNVKQFALRTRKCFSIVTLTAWYVISVHSFYDSRCQCPAATPFNGRIEHALGMCRLVCVCGFFECRTVRAGPENLLPLRNVCQFYAKQNQNRKSLSFSAFHPNSVPASSWNKRTNKIYEPLRTARLHENGEEKQKKQNAQKKKQWIVKGEMKKRAAGPRGCCVCEWVLWFKWISTFFSERRKIEAIVNGQNNRQFHGIYYYRMFGMHLDRTIWLSAVIVVGGGGDILNQTTRSPKQLFHHFQIHFVCVCLNCVDVWHWRANALP